jgi:cobalamin biosynthesis protein CobC
MIPRAGSAPHVHGGDVGAARRLFPSAPEPFIDLSTGINPHSYPLPQLPSDVFARLPEQAAVDRLATIAAESYGAPSAAHVVAAPGTQILLPLAAGLVPPGRAVVLGPTYAEHVRAAALVGHAVTEVADIESLGDADLAIAVNPNNPDGRLVEKAVLLGLANELRSHGGLLVVDEAFMDVGPDGASLANEVACGNIVVLRSFGKFFGLAGIRLGFAIATPEITARLRGLLGPWAVAGPAIAIGHVALVDRSWARAMRCRLAKSAARLDMLLTDAGLDVVGGTSLFRLVRTHMATQLFHHLGRNGILVRHFPDEPLWLRFGLPASELEWQRLHAAMARGRAEANFGTS